MESFACFSCAVVLLAELISKRMTRAEKSTAEKSKATESPSLWETPSCNLELVVSKALHAKPGQVYASAPREYVGHHKWRLAAMPAGSGQESRYLEVAVGPEIMAGDKRHPELTCATCRVEIMNWLHANETRFVEVHSSSSCSLFGETTSFQLDDSWQRDGWLGPNETLWLRAVLSPSKPTLQQAPALSENEVELLISEAYEPMGVGPGLVGRTFCEVKETADLKWKVSVAQRPKPHTPATPLAVSLGSLCPDGSDAAWQPPMAKYNFTIVNWLSWDKSAHVTGIADFSTAAHGKVEIDLPAPAGGWTREASWLGPGDTIWLRASLTSVGIKHDFRFMLRDVVLAMDAFQCMQELQQKGGLVTKTIELSPPSIGKYTEGYCVVSHYWNALAQPDKDGAQLAALKRHLLANPSIQFVWFDFCCLPQRDSGTKRRNEAEEEEFRDGLKYIYLLLLNVPVLILYDLHFLSRFWPLWEAWLAMHTPTESGLQIASEGPDQRWTIIDLQGDGESQGAGSLLAKWVHEYPDQEKVFKYLERHDVKVTNNSDKQIQLEVLSTLPADVQAALFCQC